MALQNILVVDDEPAIRESVKDILQDEGYQVYVADNGTNARKIFTTRRPDLVLLDIWMPDVDGITLLKEWTAHGDRKVPIIMISGHGTVETAVEATRYGAFDFIEKPLSLGRLVATVRNALKVPLDIISTGGKQIYFPNYPIGKSATILQVKQQVERIARAAVPVCFIGEVGSGRGFWAKFLSTINAKDESFLTVNGTKLLSDNAALMLQGSEEQNVSRPGFLAKAAGGILYIENAHRMHLDALKLLADLYTSKTYLPLGANQPKPIEARLVLSVDPFFMQSLAPDSDIFAFFHYTLAPIMVPALRDRSEDIPELLNHFVNRLVETELLPFKSFTVAAQNRLRYYSWPGNLPELKNVVRQLLLTVNKDEIDAPDVERFLTRKSTPTPEMDYMFAYPLREAREIFEKSYIQHYLDVYQGNVGQIAEICGLERTHLYRKIKALGIDIKREKLQKQ